MKIKDYEYCIIVDAEDRPMSFSRKDKQLCYCNNERWRDDVFPLTIVSVKTARKQISTTIKNRTRWGFEPDDYFIMPVDHKSIKEVLS